MNSEASGKALGAATSWRKGPRTTIPQYIKDRIIELNSQGMTSYAMAKHLGISRSTIRLELRAKNTLAHWVAQGGNFQHTKSEHPGPTAMAIIWATREGLSVKVIAKALDLSIHTVYSTRRFWRERGIS
jgi:transposase